MLHVELTPSFKKALDKMGGKYESLELDFKDTLEHTIGPHHLGVRPSSKVRRTGGYAGCSTEAFKMRLLITSPRLRKGLRLTWLYIPSTNTILFLELYRHDEQQWQPDQALAQAWHDSQCPDCAK